MFLVSEALGGCIDSGVIDRSWLHESAWCVHQVTLKPLKECKSSRTSTEPQSINLGLELTFAEDSSVHLNGTGVSFQKLFYSVVFFHFGLVCWVWAFLLCHTFLVAPGNKLLIRKKNLLDLYKIL